MKFPGAEGKVYHHTSADCFWFSNKIWSMLWWFKEER